MDKNSLVIKSSLKGILSKLLKIGILLTISLIVYFIGHSTLRTYRSTYELTSFTALLELPVKAICIVVIIYILYGVLAIIAIYSLIRIITLLYQSAKSVQIDLLERKYIITTYTFPLKKQEEKHKFNEFVSVKIAQSTMDRLCNSGNLLIEYFVCSQVDSKLRFFELENVSNPVYYKAQIMH